MTHDEFDTLILDRRMDLTRSVLSSKAAEYATEDRLHNFKRAAELQGTTPMKALIGMWTKHVVSVLDIVDKHAKDGSVPLQSRVDEKIGDAVNYLILLEGLLYEAMQAHAKGAVVSPPRTA